MDELTCLRINALYGAIIFLEHQIAEKQDYIDSIKRDYIEISSEEELSQAQQLHKAMAEKRDWMKDKLTKIILEAE